MARVLLVEDERVTRHRVRKVLENAGYEVTATASGKQALERLARESFDLMLLDVWMPEMTGIELLATLSSTETTRPPAIIITADDTPQTLLDAVRADAEAFIKKPVDPDELLATAHRALSSARRSSIRVLSAERHWVELAVPCERAAAERIQGFLVHLDADLDDDVRESIGRVFREMLLNAIEWGGKLDPTREVRVTYLRAKRMILYRIADPGEGFDFQALDHAAVGNTGDEPMKHVLSREKKGLRPGGFGILMSQSLADELLYNEAHNEVVIIKYLDG